MTPLISEMAKLSPEPETAMWFDVGDCDPREAGVRVPMSVLNLPFDRVAVAGRDMNGKAFALWLMKGDGSITVAGCSKDGPKYFTPFALFDTEQGLRYYVGGQEVPQSEVLAPMRFLTMSLVKIHLASIAFKAFAQSTHINRKRVAKGKQPLFDWHTVTIEPKTSKQSCNGGTHASPRLHDRRGHWRKHPSGKSVWVNACKVGDASKGVVFKDYRVPEKAVTA
jgi:hypothetical protein